VAAGAVVLEGTVILGCRRARQSSARAERGRARRREAQCVPLPGAGGGAPGDALLARALKQQMRGPLCVLGSSQERRTDRAT
jgi:hypothetical protein